MSVAAIQGRRPAKRAEMRSAGLWSREELEHEWMGRGEVGLGGCEEGSGQHRVASGMR